MYKPRRYREWVKTDDLKTFRVVSMETDLLISADEPLLREAEEAVEAHRKEITDYIRSNPLFEAALEPMEDDSTAPPIVREMLTASRAAGVGPMAGVAGAIAEYVGRDLLKFSGQVIVENGGDIFISSKRDRRMGVYAGDSPLSGKIGLKVRGGDSPLGICTSSGTVGHSLSFGKADAALIVSHNAALSDCTATAAGNIVKTKDDLKKAIDFAKSVTGIRGAMVIIEDKMIVWGDIELL